MKWIYQQHTCYMMSEMWISFTVNHFAKNTHAHCGRVRHIHIDELSIISQRKQQQNYINELHLLARTKKYPLHSLSSWAKKLAKCHDRWMCFHQRTNVVYCCLSFVVFNLLVFLSLFFYVVCYLMPHFFSHSVISACVCYVVCQISWHKLWPFQSKHPIQLSWFYWQQIFGRI